MGTLTQRAHIEYTLEDRLNMIDDKKIILIEISKNQRNSKSVVYDNQEEYSTKIVSKLHNRKIINIMVIALTQSGKTGTMLGLIKNYLNDTTNIIPIEILNVDEKYLYRNPNG